MRRGTRGRKGTRQREVRSRIKEIKRYWDEGPPMAFYDKGLSYEEKRRFRYGLQDYMHSTFRFEDYRDKLVLDLGCGAGIDSVEFARNGARVVSCDVSDASVNATIGLYRETGLEGVADVVQCSATQMPFRGSSFDAVYSFGVLHHIPQDKRVVSEISSILRRGGSFLGMVYNMDSLLFAYSILYLRGVKRGLLRSKDLKKLMNMTERREGNPYTKLYTKDDLRGLLERRFAVDWIKVRYNVIDTERERKIKVDVPDELDLGWHITFRCTKN
ncbi:MAG: class I SAM-dependent methyltransferase [Aigarchaeota archaeon]|nr:class I SAM-dependent methyltransferase [Aigarchaeota archaeon]MDW8092379.1 class I SAM-dependent methyltransferase [Nitrososphaerota archaeon]